MTILEIAKECGLADYRGHIKNQAELEAFAAAVLEDYKAKLVPVGWIVDGSYYDGDISKYKPNGNLVKDNAVDYLCEVIKDLPIGTKVYALGETK